MTTEQNRPSTARPTTVRDLVAVVFRQKWVILTVFTVTTLSVLMLNLRTPTTYESSGRVHVERGRKETPLLPTTRFLTWEEETSSEIETVKSYPVASRAQEILDQRYESREISQRIRLNRGGIGAGVIGESNVIAVSYTSQDASVCRPVTSAVIDAYTLFRREAQTFPQVTKFFEKEIKRAKDELRQMEQEKEDLLARLGPGGAMNREIDMASLLQGCERDLLTVESDINSARQQQLTARSLYDAGEIESAFFAQLNYQNAFTINQLREKVIQTKLRSDELASTLTPEHPMRIQAESAHESARELLGSEVASTVRLIEERLHELNSRLASLRTQESRLRVELTEIPLNKVEIDRIDNSIELKQAEIKDLSEKQTLTTVNLATSPEYTVTLIAPASAPYPKRTKDYVRMGLAPLMSLVVGMLLAFFLDSLDHSLRSPHDVEEYLKLPVLASLPESRR